MSAESQAMIALPRYKCHKEVAALKIAKVFDTLQPGEDVPSTGRLRFEDSRYAEIEVSSEYMLKHNPEAGGYYVVYEDGYLSYSPAKAFEEGYTRI